MKRLEILDYTRFLAAGSVVLYHYTFSGFVNGKITSITHTPSTIQLTQYGYLGVELFFMISGFVIYFSARNRSPSKFAVSRVVRLYPAYWFAVLFTSFFAMQWGGKLMAVEPHQMIVNLTMLQWAIEVDHIDGVYWTLIYEIKFYAAVFLMLFCGLQQKMDLIFKCWPIIFCIAFLFDLENSPYLGGYYYYFSAGTLLAQLKERFTITAALALLISFIFCIHFSIENSHHTTTLDNIQHSPVVIASIITLFFSLFTIQISKKVQEIKLPFSKTLGALSYPIYLIHAHFGFIVINEFATENNKTGIYVLTVTIVLLVSCFVNILLEKNLSNFWNRLIHNSLGRSIEFLQTMPSKFLKTHNDHSN